MLIPHKWKLAGNVRTGGEICEVCEVGHHAGTFCFEYYVDDVGYGGGTGIWFKGIPTQIDPGCISHLHRLTAAYIQRKNQKRLFKSLGWFQNG